MHILKGIVYCKSHSKTTDVVLVHNNLFKSKIPANVIAYFQEQLKQNPKAQRISHNNFTTHPMKSVNTLGI